jgi:RNA polymerase sigma-70 factor (ECF subfamily)
MKEWASLSDEDLVRKAQNAADGDLRPFEVLVNRYRQKVLTNCRYLTRASSESEDLAQDVFLKMFFGIKGFEHRAAFKTWIMRVKANHCLNWIGKKRGQSFVDIQDPIVEAGEEALQVAPEAERATQALDDRERIEQVLDSMTDNLRIPLLMRDLDQMSYQEIADEIGIGLSAVKMRIKRARETFQQRFGDPA